MDSVEPTTYTPDVPVDPQELRYIDFICSDTVMRPIIDQLAIELGIPIVYLTADPTRSGPKEDYAVETFAQGEADFGRI